MFRIVLKDVFGRRRGKKRRRVLFRRGEKITGSELPPSLPAECCSHLFDDEDESFFLIHKFNRKKVTILHTGSRDRLSLRTIPRSDIDVYGPILDAENRHAIILRIRAHHGLLVQA